MGRKFALMMAAALGLTASTSLASLSGNLVVNGDFESTANLKTAANDTDIHKFSQNMDVGNWVSMWGPDTINGNGNGGFSLHDDPRAVGLDPKEVGSMNRSLDAGNGNHFMENVEFRPKWAQWIEAPAHITGPIELSFDFFLDRWDATGHAGSRVVFQALIYGTNELPAHDTGFAGDVNGPVMAANGLQDAALLARYNYGDFWNGSGQSPDTDTVAGNVNGWLSVSSNNAGDWSPNPGNVGGRGDILLTELTATYDYYAVVFQTRSYDENNAFNPDLNLQLIGSDKPTPTMTVGVDNVSFQVTVPEPASMSLLGLGSALLLRRRQTVR